MDKTVLLPLSFDIDQLIDISGSELSFILRRLWILELLAIFVGFIQSGIHEISSISAPELEVSFWQFLNMGHCKLVGLHSHCPIHQWNLVILNLDQVISFRNDNVKIGRILTVKPALELLRKILLSIHHVRTAFELVQIGGLLSHSECNLNSSSDFLNCIGTFVGNLFAVTCDLEVPDAIRIERHFFLVQCEGMVWEKAQGSALHCAG